MKIDFLNKSRNVYILLIVVAFVLYGNTLRNKYALDDNLLYENNPVIENGISGIPEVFTTRYVENDKHSYEYRPLVKLLAGLEFLIWKYTPALSHLLNILLYALILLVLYQLLQMLFRGYGNSVVLLIVLLFAAHPIHTEVVASLKNRDELMSMFFAFLSAKMFLRWGEEKSWKGLLWGSVLFYLAMLSKTSALVFVALIPLMFYLVKTISLKKGIFVFFLLFLLAAGFFVIPQVLMSGGVRNPEFFENPLFFDQSITSILGVAGLTLIHYLKLMIFPHPLLYYYGYDMIPVVPVYDLLAITGLLLHLGLFIWSVLLLKKRNVVGFGIMYYLIAISMFANILIPAMGIVADRYMFNAVLGFCIIVGWVLYFGKVSFSKELKKASISRTMTYLAALILLLYSVKTINRNADWKDSLSLYEADMAYLDDSFKAHVLYSNAMFKEVVRTAADPKFSKRNADWTKKSVVLLEKAVNLYDGYPNAWNSLGAIHFMLLRDNLKAKDYFFKAYSLKRDYPEVIFNIGFCYENLGMRDSAMWYYNHCIEIDSLYANPYNRKLLLLFDTGDTVAGLKLNEQMKQIFPESDAPYINLGNYLLLKGDTAAAFEQWEIAIEKVPENPQLLDALYQYFSMIGNKGKANEYLNMNKQLQRDKRKQSHKPVFL